MHFLHYLFLLLMAFCCNVFRFVCHHRVGVEEEMELQTFDSMHTVSYLKLSFVQQTRKEKFTVFTLIYCLQCQLVSAEFSETHMMMMHANEAAR